MKKPGKTAFEGTQRVITYPIKSIKRDWPTKILESFHMGLDHLGNIIDHPFTVTTEDGVKVYCVETYSTLDSKTLMVISKFCDIVGFDYEVSPKFGHWNQDSCVCIAFRKTTTKG
jgi:hypothetical protein